jgi:predicted nucleic acid-binding protein
MIDPGERCLVDTNILLMLVKRDHLQYPLVRGAVETLVRKGAVLYYTLQNMAKFWNACTRPTERNGFGLSIEDTETRALEVEAALTLLPDPANLYVVWRRLVLTHRVIGVKVHDARMAAVLRVYGMRHLLTINEADFLRYPGIRVLTPTVVWQGR